MLGERVVLADSLDGRIGQFVAALARFPAEPAWAVVGALAVNVRIAEVHQLTSDVDTVSRDQAALADMLAEEVGAQRLSAARLRLGDGPGVEVDVMSDTAGQQLPDEPSGRAFALARRMAVADADTMDVVVADGTSVAAEASVPVASTASLIALKTVAVVHRPAGNNPHKVGTDIHDLVRLVRSGDVGSVAEQLEAHSSELCAWTGTTMARLFSADRDLRYTQLRLRRFDASPDAHARTAEQLAYLGRVGEVLQAHAR